MTSVSHNSFGLVIDRKNLSCESITNSYSKIEMSATSVDDRYTHVVQVGGRVHLDQTQSGTGPLNGDDVSSEVWERH